MNDLISRQAAIDVLDAYQVKIENGEENPYAWARLRMSELPPAQPEIVHCKDCKHWIPYDWMFSEVWRSKNIADYPEDEIGCNFCDVAMKANDFCSRAERKTNE